MDIHAKDSVLVLKPRWCWWWWWLWWLAGWVEARSKRKCGTGDGQEISRFCSWWGKTLNTFWAEWIPTLVLQHLRENSLSIKLAGLELLGCWAEELANHCCVVSCWIGKLFRCNMYEHRAVRTTGRVKGMALVVVVVVVKGLPLPYTEKE